MTKALEKRGLRLSGRQDNLAGPISQSWPLFFQLLRKGGFDLTRFGLLGKSQGTTLALCPTRAEQKPPTMTDYITLRFSCFAGGSSISRPPA